LPASRLLSAEYDGGFLTVIRDKHFERAFLRWNIIAPYIAVRGVNFYAVAGRRNEVTVEESAIVLISKFHPETAVFTGLGGFSYRRRGDHAYTPVLYEFYLTANDLKGEPESLS